MIKVTQDAVKQLRELLSSKDLSPATHGLRLGVERGGCAGMQYIMQISEQKPDDTIVEEAGVKFFLSADSLSFLSDSQVDYEDSLSDAGFRIHNPNAQRTCGCGTSFESS